MHVKNRILYCAILAFLILLSSCSQNDKPVALGTLERDRITLTATANEIIRELPVKEGSFIQAGDILVKLDTLQQEAKLEKAKAEENKAKAYLARMVSGERPEDIASAREKLNHAEATLIEERKSYDRIAELVDRKLASISDKDKARAERDAAQADYNSAKENLGKLISGERIEDVQQAEAALAVAQADVRLQQHLLNELTIVATRDGILDELPYNVGERVPMSATVALIQADSAPYARVYIPEPFRARLFLNQELGVHIDGFDQLFKGSVRWVSKDPSFTPYFALNEKDRSRLVYLAEIDLIDEKLKGDIPTGLPVQVDMPDD